MRVHFAPRLFLYICWGSSEGGAHAHVNIRLVRVSCEIQRNERARLLVAPDKARRPLPPLLFAVACCSNTTDGGTADLARALRLAPANARFGAYCRAASRAVVDFSLSTGGKEGRRGKPPCGLWFAWSPVDLRLISVQSQPNLSPIPAQSQVGLSPISAWPLV